MDPNTSDIFILIEFLNKMNKQSRASSNWRTKVTKTYFPGSGYTMQLIKLEEVVEIRKFGEKVKYNPHENSLVPIGLANAWTKNNSYKELLVEAGLDSISSSDILQILKKSTLGDHSRSHQNHEFKYRYSYWIDTVPNEIKEEVIQRLQRGVKLPTIASLVGISQTLWRTIINQWKWEWKQDKI